VDWMIWDSIPGEKGRRFLSSSNLPERIWGPNSFLFNKKHYSFPEVKTLGRDVNHLSSSSAEVKNEWSYLYCHNTPSWREQKKFQLHTL
jgi:hypothetical protein